MNRVKVAVIQMRCAASLEENLKKAEAMVRKAAAEGANVILLPELFEREYFCQQRRYDFYHYAKPVMENDAVRMGMRLAAELGVVLPISFYERDVNNLYNSIACIDADGTVLGVYRKTHIPDDHYYQEKFYFTPGDTGFQVFSTRYGRIGVGICWDQWFPESARCMALAGAELLFLSDGDRIGTDLRVRQYAALETLYAGTCGSQSDARCCGKPDRGGDGRTL